MTPKIFLSIFALLVFVGLIVRFMRWPDSKARKPQDNMWYMIGWLCLVQLLLLSSCASHKKVQDFSTVQVEKSEAVKIDTTRAKHTDTSVYPLPDGSVTVTTPERTGVGKLISKATGRDKVSVKNGSVILPRKNKGSISVNIGSGSATAVITGKKATAAVGEDATTTSIGKVKAPTAVGEGIQQHVAAKNGVAGIGNTVTKPAKGKPWWILVAVAGAYGVWWLIAGGIALPAFLARANAKTLAWIFAGVAAVLAYFFLL